MKNKKSDLQPVKSQNILSRSGACFKNWISKIFFRGRSKGDKNQAKESYAQKVIFKHKIFETNFANFGSKSVEDIVIPRSDIFAVEDNISIDELTLLISEQNHTRTLVYKENLDNITGFVHIKDIFSLLAKKEKFLLNDILRKHLVIPGAMNLFELLTLMQSSRTHIAVIVDEYGGTDGIVTIEDLMEEIVGEIEDEHDDTSDSGAFKRTKPGVIISSSRVDITEIESATNMKLRADDDEFDTIGGLVLARSGTIPNIGDIIEITEGFSVEILDATARTVTKLKIFFDDSNFTNK